MKPIIFVDGSSYFFRAFHALPPLLNSKGLPTGAIYGVVNMVKRLIKDNSPEQMVVVFDTKGSTFREALYADYKAHRPPMPSDLSVQFEPLIKVLKLMGVPLAMIEGVEADDVIGTLTQDAVKQGKKVLISTSDKDFAQLVNEDVILLNTMSNLYLDINGVKTKMGVWPHQMIDYLTLVGDSVDNIPGVPKCGPKTAAKWLETYGSLDNLVANATAISGKIGESLRASLAQFPLTKQLVTIKTDVALPIHLQDCRMQLPNIPELVALLEELEFKSWLRELNAASVGVGSHAVTELEADLVVNGVAATNYLAIQDTQSWAKFLRKLQDCELCAISIQASAFDPFLTQIVGVSLSVRPNEAVYIPLQHVEADPATKQQDVDEAPQEVGIEVAQLSLTSILADLKPHLENPRLLKIGRNLKFEWAVLQQHGITLRGMAYDTMLQSYLLNSSAARHDLETLALKYLDYQPLPLKKLTKRGNQYLSFHEISIDEAMFYSAEEVDVIIKLHHHLHPKLSPGMMRVLEAIEMPLVPVLASIERKGVLIDKDVLYAQGTLLKTRLHKLQEEAFQLADHAFNLQSPLQLQTILFEEQGLPVIEKTPKGQPSTAESALQELAYTYRLPAIILEHRRLNKLVSTYIDALPKYIHPQTGRVHTTLNQAVTATGRLSSTEPNLQNIPIRSEEGRAIRQAFIAPPGYCLLAADYSQIELRIMAHLSQDARLLQAFKDGLDIHTATAAEIFFVPVEQVTSEHRRCAKAVNFGLIYGMSAFGLARQLGIDRTTADTYVKTYFERYPGVLAYMERTRLLAHEKGFVETIFGHRLYLTDIKSHQMPRRKAAERMAINAPMQGSAAELIKLAMIKLWQWQETEGQGIASMILQVHDELLLEVDEAQVTSVKQVVKTMMENVITLSVPLEVSIGVGKNWAEAH